MRTHWTRATRLRPSRRPTAQPYRLRLHSLEDRTAPAAFRLGSTLYDDAKAVAADASGNLYVAGEFRGTVDFDPGPGVVSRTAVTTPDTYLAKYTAAGALLWVGTIPGASIEDLAVAPDGSVVATGDFERTVDFDFGAGTTNLTSASFGSAFVAKYAPTGALTWARQLGRVQFGAEDASTFGSAVAVDPAGNVYSAGSLSRGFADMDPGPGTFNLRNLSGNGNVYISKLDAGGNFVWAKQIENDPTIAATVWAADLAVDPSQNVYLTGGFRNRVDFDPGPGTLWQTEPADTGGDGYALKLTPAGALSYVVPMNGLLSRDDGSGIVADAAGNAYVTGWFRGTLRIPGSANPLTSAGQDDVFVLGLSPTGGVNWARRVGSTGADGGQAIAFDGTDNLYLSGYFAQTVDFDPNAGTTNLTWAGGFTDVFGLRLKTDSTFVNAWGLGGGDFEFGTAVAVTPAAQVVIAGRFQGTADFDPGLGVQNLSSAGESDAFVAVLPQSGANLPPTATADGYDMNEDGTLTINSPGVLGNDTDPEGQPLTAVKVTDPANGSVTLNANGSFTYRPNRNFNGTDSFTYKANDGTADSNVATVTITVRPVNDAPFPSPIVLELTTAEDTPLSDRLRAVDVDGDELTFTLEQGPTVGSIVLNPDGTFTYTPPADFSGVAEVLYRVSDPAGASNLGGLRVTITPVNDAPAGAADTYTVDEDGTLTITADPVTRLRMVSEPGDFIGQGLTYDFTPATAAFDADVNFDNGVSFDVDPPPVGEWWFLDFAAPGNAFLAPGTYLNAQRFPFQAADRPGLNVSGNGRGSNTLTGQFTVYDAEYSGSTVTRFAAGFEQHSEGKPPALIGWVMYNSTFGAGGGVLGNDTDVEADLLLGATLVDGPAHGTLTFRGDGTFTYTPDPNFHGTDTFTYKPHDGRADGAVATVTITVKPVNDAPVAADDTAATAEDTALTDSVAATDVDGDTLSYTVVSGPTNGTLTSFNTSTGAFVYTPNANYNGSDSFTFKANDGTADSNMATFAITVRSVNDAPVAANDSFSVAEDTPLHGSVSATDVDGDPLTFALVGGPAHGQVTVNPDGTFTYTPAANYHGPDSFTFQANDGTTDSNTATVSLTVTPVNDVPVASDGTLTTAEDSPKGGTLSATDIDGDPLTFALVSGPAHGAVTVNSDGTYTYTPAANYHGADSFTFKANDGSVDSNVGTVAITVTPVNDAPVASGGSLETAEDTAGNGSLSATDVDGDALTYTVVSGPTNGTLTGFNSATGAFTYTPNANYNGSDSFTFKANDGTADSNTATVSITVAPVNDAPVASDGSLTTTANASASGSLAATDVDGDLLTFAVVGGPANGTLTAFDPATGAFTYTPTAGFSGEDSFTFTANDGAVDSNTATVAITVHPDNRPPTAIDDRATTDEDTPVTVAVLTNDTDPDGDPLTVTAVTQPAHGTAVLNADGTVTYTPAADFNGTDSFTYTIDDGNGGTATATVTLTVKPVNDAPVADPASFTTDEDTKLRGRLTGSDVDGDGLTFRKVSGPAHGRAAVFPGGKFVYRPDPDFHGTDSFTFRVSDGRLTSEATVTITVLPVNDAPVAKADSYSVLTGDELTVPGAGVLANDTDVDGDPLTAVLVSGPNNGRLTLNPDGSFRYMAGGGFAGTDSFTYRATDPAGAGDTATVTIRVERGPNTTGKVTGGGSVVGGARKFDLSVRSDRKRGVLALSGNFQFRDEAAGLRLDATAVRSFRVDGDRAVFTGAARVNGKTGYEFTVIVEDLGEPGVGSDTFRVLISGPGGFDYDSFDHATSGGVLDGGNLQVHPE